MEKRKKQCIFSGDQPYQKRPQEHSAHFLKKAISLENFVPSTIKGDHREGRPYLRRSGMLRLSEQ